jgi:glycosyltransferase involved in cell wall biosynthesis
MRRILFVLETRFLPGFITGQTVSAHALCARLAAEGHEPIVVCLPEPRDAAPPQGAPVPAYTVLCLADPVTAMIEMIGALAPDAVVVHGTQAAAKAAGMPTARQQRLHIYFSTTFYGYPAPTAEAAPKFHYAVNSPYLAMFAQAYLGHPVALVPPVIESEQYRCRPQGDCVLFVNPVASKGVHLVDAIAERLPHRRFLIVKSWPHQQRFPNVSFQRENAEWLESTHDMRPVYARAKLVLMPTIMEEGWGRTVSEAQVSGIPAIVSDRGGHSHTVGPGGLALSLGEPVERWCAAIEELFNDPTRYRALSEAARRHAARDELVPANVTARFLEFLAS